MTKRIEKTDEQWKQELTPEQYRIMRQKGTERAFTGEYYDNHDAGMYRCAACGNELFPSDTKFESGSGWPSFFPPTDENNVKTETDNSHGMRRTEVLCSACDAHLGHLFPDGPRDKGGMRYCINSASLKFDKKG